MSWRLFWESSSTQERLTDIAEILINPAMTAESKRMVLNSRLGVNRDAAHRLVSAFPDRAVTQKVSHKKCDVGVQNGQKTK